MTQADARSSQSASYKMMSDTKSGVLGAQQTRDPRHNVRRSVQSGALPLLCKKTGALLCLRR
jgi:hypothetical protein